MEDSSPDLPPPSCGRPPPPDGPCETGPVRVAFDSYELDTDAYELRRDGRPVAVEPQVFDVLAHLVRHRGQLVTKEELLDAVWGDRFVSESALTSRIKAVRHAVGDDGRAQRLVKTVHGRGYRFTADTVDLSGAGSPEAPAGPVRPRVEGTDGTGRPERPPGSRPVPSHNLPGERTPLLGRDDDARALAALLPEHRLVSLLGIGGAGKTRLAVAVARSVVAGYDDGVWFVDLQAVRTGREVVGAVAEAAGLVLDSGAAREQLAVRLSSRGDTLIVLDNCEHVVEAVADLLDHLLLTTDGPRFLVTSRVPLGLPEERRFPVRPLPVAATGAAGIAGSPAVQLFVAAAARAGVELGARDLRVALTICRHLDGLPLALEVAAAQLPYLTVDELAARLDRRFELRGPARAPDRQSTLRAVLDDTWAMMSDAERTTIARLAVFPGSFGADDVEGVAADLPADELAQAFAGLADRSLVVREPAAARGHRLLETVRLFAAQSAGEAEMEVAADQHAAWCLRRVGTSVAAHVYDFDLASWCHLHHEDLRVAEAHLCARGRPDDAAALTSATALAMHLDDGSRAGEVSDRVAAHLDRVDDPVLRVRLHLTGVMCAMAIRSPTALRAHGAAAIERPAGDPVVDAIALVLASWSAVLDDGDVGLRMLDRAERLAIEAGASRTRALARGYRGYFLATLRRFDEAVRAVEGFGGLAPEDSDYPELVGVSARHSCTFLDDPTASVAWVDAVQDFPSERCQMWANQLLAAAVHAAHGDAAATGALVWRIRDRLARAGLDGLPDLLVPVAVLAHRLGEDRSAVRWLDAVRTAGRPTQSFQATVLYRRAREVIGRPATADADGGAPDTDVTAAGDEALAWLTRVADDAVTG